MPKIIQMPRRTKPENEGHPIHRSMILAESESLSKIQRWLEMGDSELGEKKISLKQRPA
jgi:hypothetical protein